MNVTVPTELPSQVNVLSHLNSHIKINCYETKTKNQNLIANYNIKLITKIAGQINPDIT